MQIYVGITDYNWFQFLKNNKADEVNFWKPGSQPFKALQENDLFLRWHDLPPLHLTTPFPQTYNNITFYTNQPTKETKTMTVD